MLIQMSSIMNNSPNISAHLNNAIESLKETDLLSGSNSCVFAALFFQKHYPNLRLVVGSLGIGMDDPFWEYGGPTYKNLKQFRMNGVSEQLDGHVWCQDEQGLIYDVVTSYMIKVAAIHQKKIGLKDKMIVKKVSKDSLVKLGFHYMPAPTSIEKDLLKMALNFTEKCLTNTHLSNRKYLESLNKVDLVNQIQQFQEQNPQFMNSCLSMSSEELNQKLNQFVEDYDDPNRDRLVKKLRQ